MFKTRSLRKLKALLCSHKTRSSKRLAKQIQHDAMLVWSHEPRKPP